MFESLGEYPFILVTGPQRSGTRVCAKMIAYDLPTHWYVDETQIHIDSLYALEILLQQAHGDNYVVQCPALCRYIHYFGGRDDCLIALVRRGLVPIVESQARVGWMWDPLERMRYQGVQHAYAGPPTPPVSQLYEPPDLSIAEVKYRFFATAQKPRIKHWVEVAYESLSNHPLWVSKEERGGFTATQTSRRE